MSDVSSVAVRAGSVKLSAALRALGDRGRWDLLVALGDGQPKMVVELARIVGRRADTVSKQVKILLDAGLVARGQAGMYRIPVVFLPEVGVPVADYGYFVLRLDVREPE